jgi:hypothetical protein
MALQISLPANRNRLSDAPAPQAYARIDSLEFNTKTGAIELVVGVSLNAAARQANKGNICIFRHRGVVGSNGVPSLDDALASGVRSALYTWLKTLPEYAGAVDV